MKCGICDQDGHTARQCSWEGELTGPPEKLPKQYKRCPDCHKIIYAWDAGLPCDKHRVVADWQEYYHSEQFVTDSAGTREKIAQARKRKPGTSRGRELAAQQLAEARALRGPME